MSTRCAPKSTMCAYVPTRKVYWRGRHWLNGPNFPICLPLDLLRWHQQIMVPQTLKISSRTWSLWPWWATAVAPKNPPCTTPPWQGRPGVRVSLNLIGPNYVPHGLMALSSGSCVGGIHVVCGACMHLQVMPWWGVSIGLIAPASGTKVLRAVPAYGLGRWIIWPLHKRSW